LGELASKVLNSGNPKEVGKIVLGHLGKEVISTVINNANLNETCKDVLNKFGTLQKKL
jgi:hypothetical protein